MMKILHQEDTKFYLKISSCADVEQLDERKINWCYQPSENLSELTLYILKHDKYQNIGKTVWTTLTIYQFKLSGNIISMMWQSMKKIHRILVLYR